MGFLSPKDGGHALDLSAEEARRLPVFGVAVRYPAGYVVPQHKHPYGHLIHADRGLLRVEAESGQWLVPPTAAVWLRSGVKHRLVVPVALQAHGLFVREDVCTSLPAADCVVHVSSLLRELIMALARDNDSATSSKRMRLLGALLIEELRTPPILPLHLPWPTDSADSRMQHVCQALLDNPGDTATAAGWANRLAMGDKTFHRRFLLATGMTFGKWRQQLRLMSSLTLLMQGMPITQVALASGYDSHSAYTTAFGKQFGQPPSAFAADI
ncbi:AraC family transcriptional regulator [Parazoarcus communis]|uniref:AraC family transcriptional regulator n=2 Tax=Parazoarcus communis TaxID=41977 RepID=A0A323UMT9_9RHOO|nr:helix-turn-helix transcriptional regulator [Parazoarcus communis]NMG72830.1 helix-turn-helix domain-containing protein [Parazoarcus communis SWub3 = DSM 12120]PZA14312.1 AraC family transcriptional regulator [Azoarcus communis] [Parazoarcus communis SWub3 = DSM 12120]